MLNTDSHILGHFVCSNICYISLIWLCVKRTSNVHKDRTQESRNSKNTWRLLSSGTKHFITLSLKVLRHKERDTHSFYSGFFIWLPSRATPAQGLREQAKVNPSRSVSSLNSTNWLFQNLPKSCPRFRCVTSFALASSVSHLGLLWYLWVARLLRPRAREHMR